jgi:tetratricopeptide (TPR) repeat protein
MRALSVATVVGLAGLAVTNPAGAEDSQVGAGCSDAVGRGVWELAIDLCSLEMLPADASAETKARILLGRAKAYQETGDTKRAAADAAEAEQLAPGSAAAFNAAAASRSQADGALRNRLREIQALWDSGNDGQAIAALDRVIAANPRSAQAYAMRASIYLARRDDPRAQADIQSATALAKNCALKPRQQAYALTCPE